MAHIEKRGPRRYMAVWTDPAGRKRSASFPRKVDAERHLAVTVAAMLRREWIDPDAGGKITLGEWCAAWLDTRGTIRGTTRDRIRAELGYLGTLDNVPLARLTPSLLEQWQARMLAQGGARGQPLSVGTVLLARATLTTALRAAVRDRIIATNPWAGVGKPRAPARRVSPLPHTTVHQIAVDITPWYRVAVLLGAWCGLRRGEAFGLARDSIDFGGQSVAVTQSLAYQKSRGLHIGPTKTEASVRDVPLPGFVAREIAAHLLRWPASDGLVFHTRTGAPVSATLLADAWRRVAPAGSRFHDLRHYYASTLIEGGASVKEVQARLGHAGAGETLDTYAHLWPDSADRTRTRLEDAWSALDRNDKTGKASQ